MDNAELIADTMAEFHLKKLLKTSHRTFRAVKNWFLQDKISLKNPWFVASPVVMCTTLGTHLKIWDL